MHLSVMSIAFRSLAEEGAGTLADLIRFCAGLEVQAVEIAQVDEGPGPGGPASVDEALRDTGLSVASYNCRLPLLSEDRAERNEAMAAFGEVVTRARALAAPGVMLFPSPTGLTSPESERARLIEACEACAGRAGEQGIALTVENVGTETGRAVVGTAAHMLELVRGVGPHPHFGLVYDVGNFVHAGDEPWAALEKLWPHTLHVHLKDLVEDGEGYEEVAIGEGAVDVRGIVREIRRRGYGGCLSLECASEGDRAACERMVATSVANVRAMLAS